MKDPEDFAVLGTPWYKFSEEIDPSKVWGRCFVFVQGEKFHSGVRWHRPIIGDAHWRGHDWDAMDIARLVKHGDMDFGKVTHFAKFQPPQILPEMDDKSGLLSKCPFGGGRL